MTAIEPTRTDDDAAMRLKDCTARARRVQAAVRRNVPKQIANVLSELIASRGYAQVQSNEDLSAAWGEAAGPLAKFTRAVGIRRGKLEVIATSSTLLQELRLQEHDLLARLGQLLPHERITGLKLKSGAIN
jgi:predicted nucleic acid-binding Zn ribbon protein